MSSSWSLRLAGVPRLLSAMGTPPCELPLSRKDAAWLAVVARCEGAASRQVAMLVWPDAGERAALNHLRQRVYRLRRATGARLVEMGERIVPAADVHLVREDIAALVGADVEAAPGRLLDGHEYDAEPELAAWLAHQRQADLDALRAALAARAAAAEQEGALATALRCGERLVALEPLSEYGHRRLMRLHYLRGDRAGAIAAFERCERVLKDELGLRPEAETLALLDTIEQGRGAAPAKAQPMPAGLLRPPRLVGRDAALAELAAAERAAEICVLVGEAGMGKSRLLQEALGARREVLLVQARPGDAAAPYVVLGRLLRALRTWRGAAAGDGMKGAGATDTLADGIGAALALLEAAPVGPTAAAAPMTARALQTLLERLLLEARAAGLALLAADDLHFADPASLDMLLTLMHSDALPTLRWVLAHRPLASVPDPGVLAVLAEAPQLRTLRLQPLDAAQLHELLASLALPCFDPTVLAPTLLRHTGGNPLFVVETLRAAWHQGGDGGTGLPLPQGLAHLIDARLARLSRPALTLARLAALAAPDFDLALAEGVLGVPAIALTDAWQELEAAQILSGEVFAHDLVHEALRRSMPRVIAARTHRQVAALLAARDVAPVRLAQHWLAGEEPALAARSFERAAALARQSGRLRECGDLLEHSAGAFDTAGDAEAALRVRIERVLVLRSDRGAEVSLAAADALLESARGSPLAAHLLVARARVLGWIGCFDDAEATAREALAAAAPDDDAVRTVATIMLANAQELRGDAAGALSILLPWQATADRVARSEIRCLFQGLLTSVLLQLGRIAQALAAAQQHLGLAHRGGHGEECVTALMSLASVHGHRGDAEQAAEHARAADRLLLEVPWQMATLGPWNRATAGFWLAGAGRYGEALQGLEDAITALAAMPVQRTLAQSLLGRLWITLGQSARAVALANTMPEMPPGPVRAAQSQLRAWVEQLQCSDNVETWRAVAASVPEDNPVHIGACIVLAARSGDGIALARWHRHAARRELFSLAAEAATLLLALVDVSVEQVEDAEQRVLAAPSPLFYLPEQLERCAVAYRRLGRQDDAARCLGAALDWVHRQALPHVPPPFVESFLHRNPVNARLRAWQAMARPDALA